MAPIKGRHLICLHIFRYLARKSLDIRQYAFGISVQSDEKSDSASAALSLCDIALTSNQVGGKLETADIIAEQSDESKTQIRRYIRLTKLIPDILKMVDEQRIAFSVGVELSYLTEYEQQDLFEAIELEDKTPSLSQAIQMKKLSQAGKLDSETIAKIISEEKPNQREKISFQLDELSKYFPKKFTPQDIYKRLLKLAQDDYRRRQRSREER